MPQKDSRNPPPEFVELFNGIRKRPDRSDVRLHRRMWRRAQSRKSPPRSDGLQRGDIAEPPPVLDLEVERPRDRDRVCDSLVRYCVSQPVWEIRASDEDTGHPEDEGRGIPHSRDVVRGKRRAWIRRRPRLFPPSGAGTAAGPHEHEEPVREPVRPRATTKELYEYMEELVEQGFTWPDLPTPAKHRQAPPPPRFRRLRSLLWLSRIDYGAAVRKAHKLDLDDQKKEVTDPSGREHGENRPERGEEGAPSETGRDPDSEGKDESVSFEKQDGLLQHSETHNAIVHQLRMVRLSKAEERADQAEKDLKRARSGGNEEAVRDAERTGRRASWALKWRKLVERNSPLLQLAARIAVRLRFDRLDDLLLTPSSFILKVVGALPVLVAASTATFVDDLLAQFAFLVLGTAYAVVLLCVVVPWHPYRWLAHHRYLFWAPTETANLSAGHRSRAAHVLRRLGELSETEGRVGEGEEPPGVHRLVVNALLDDLQQAYGDSGGRVRPRLRGRTHRPVLVFKAEGLDRVSAYLVQLIEDERLRRGFPDPLLIVQVRGKQTPSLVREVPDVHRHLKLAESNGKSYWRGAMESWARGRHAAGTLGSRRTVHHRITALPEHWPHEEDLPDPYWVRTAAAQTGHRVVSGALVLVLVGGGLQAVALGINSCVQWGGLVPPDGVTEIRTPDGEKACVGLTDGRVVFDERLEAVTKEIARHNAQVDRGEHPYVTVAYLGEMSGAGEEADEDHVDYNLSGVQGELLGLGEAQRLHNGEVDAQPPEAASSPKVKILLGNAGPGWSHALPVAEEITERARDERLGMDRPLAAVGFGHSVEPNSMAIQEIGTAGIPMVGTTATYDRVASAGEGLDPNQHFFPLAASNSRIATQAAHWARNGAATSKGEEGQEEELVMEPSSSAVVVANGAVDEDGDSHEQYGPHLGERFIEEFTDRGGTPWTPEGDFATGSTTDGLMLYQPRADRKGPSINQVVSEVCHSEREQEPPDLVYYAGRSEEFSVFLRALGDGGSSMCAENAITVLGADDITKFAADEEEKFDDELREVFYTPLVPSAPWEGSTAETDETDYHRLNNRSEKLHPEEEDPRKLPSIAHAALASDAQNVVNKALAFLDVSEETQDGAGYSGVRNTLHLRISGTESISGMSGSLAMSGVEEGNWHPHRMVQLVQVGPALADAGGEKTHQHVLDSCGMDVGDSGFDTRNCIDTGASDLGQGSGAGP